MVEEEGPMENL